MHKGKDVLDVPHHHGLTRPHESVRTLVQRGEGSHRSQQDLHRMHEVHAVDQVRLAPARIAGSEDPSGMPRIGQDACPTERADGFRSRAIRPFVPVPPPRGASFKALKRGSFGSFAIGERP